tara:strand:- start:4332 stop:4616 length:285 start_codon:yes stop_codon:yes gene_type:complete
MSDRDRITKSVSNALYELIRVDLLNGNSNFDQLIAAYIVRILDNFDERLKQQTWSVNYERPDDWVSDQLKLLVKNLEWIRLERSVAADEKATNS